VNLNLKIHFNNIRILIMNSISNRNFVIQMPIRAKGHQPSTNLANETEMTPKKLQQVFVAARFSPLVALALTKSGFCLANHLHGKVMITAHYLTSICSKLSLPIDKLISFPINELAQNLPKKLQYLPKELQFFSRLTITAPLVEEVFFRGVIQELFLKRGAAALLRMISPKAAQWVESNPKARVGRVAISTLLFALAHVNSYGCAQSIYFQGSIDAHNCAMSNRAIGVIAGGIAYGSFVEFWGSKIGIKQALIGSIFMHSQNNLIAYAINRGLGVSLDPIFDQ
jgi:membrane protease YdiL (CAAX protease family)